MAAKNAKAWRNRTSPGKGAKGRIAIESNVCLFKSSLCTSWTELTACIASLSLTLLPLLSHCSPTTSSYPMFPTSLVLPLPNYGTLSCVEKQLSPMTALLLDKPSISHTFQCRSLLAITDSKSIDAALFVKCWACFQKVIKCQPTSAIVNLL